MGGSNPFKSVRKAVKKAVSQTSSELSRGGDTLSKAGSSLGATLSDPGTWVAAMSGGMMAGQVMGAAKARETYKAMSQAEKDEANAEAERRTAMNEEARQVEDQKKAQAEQSKMVKEREAKATARSEDRARRLGTGRRGLLYQGAKGSEAGTSTVLGG